MRDFFWRTKELLMILLAFLVGGGIDALVKTNIDYWIHDEAVVIQERKDWKHVAIVALDEKVPIYVGRQQAIPLFARAADVLASVGAKGFFLDAMLSKEIEAKMPYAACIMPSGDVQWSLPKTWIDQNQCQIDNSAKGNAPLAMSKAALDIFRIAPYQAGQEDLSDGLLYGKAEQYIPPSGIVREVGVIKKNEHSAVNRWIELNERHAVIDLAKMINPKQVADSLKEDHEFCEQKKFCSEIATLPHPEQIAYSVTDDPKVCLLKLPCRRIRFSRPVLNIQESGSKLILPISQLAACDDRVARQSALQLKDRVVIFQLTTPTEMTDVHVIPTTTAVFGSNLLIPGSQYLGDAIETILANDQPREPSLMYKAFIFLIAAALGVLGSLYLKNIGWLWLIGPAFCLLLGALCILSPISQLLPVTSAMIAFVFGALEGIGLHLIIGSKEARLVTQYMPKQVHDILMPLKINQSFQDKQSQAIVLMSDLSGYTTMTSILNEPALLLSLMNDYLTETSFVLQDSYQGWLESYIGDMVCYYWPYEDKDKAKNFDNALKGAVALWGLQKHFFEITLPQRYQHQFSQVTLDKIIAVIDAGIGLSAGDVIMGNLGPKAGVRKFGILGDPMNLTARVESLTRFFNTEIIVTEEFLDAATRLGYPTRRLGCYQVKGRHQSVNIYALGTSEDPRFQSDVIKMWEHWLSVEEREGDVNVEPYPEIFQHDKDHISVWKRRNLLRNGVWVLDLK